MNNKEKKIYISNGCVEYLIDEVKRLRTKTTILVAKTEVMDNFFSMVNRLGPAPSQGYGEDRFHQAQKEFRESCPADQPVSER